MSFEAIPESNEAAAPARFSRTKLSLASAALVSCGLLMMLAGASSAKHTSLRATASSLFAHDVESFPIHRVHYQHDSVRPNIICAPDLAQLILPAEIPHLEAHVAMHHLLDVTPDRGVGLDDVAEVPACTPRQRDKAAACRHPGVAKAHSL